MLDNEEKILLYQTDNGKVTVDACFEGETFWLTQKTLAELFDTTVANINIHIQNMKRANLTRRQLLRIP